MNHRVNRSLGLAAIAAVASSASAQYYNPACWTDDGGPSDDYIFYVLPEGEENDLFKVGLGIFGTMAYRKECLPPNGFTFNVPGRVGFAIGSEGSVQSDLDDNLFLNYGMGDQSPFAMAGGGTGYGMLITQAADGTGAITKTLFGSNDFTAAFIGASDRYCRAIADFDTVRVSLRIDLLGDAARLNWELTNNGDAATRLGLWFGQWVTLLDQANQNSQNPRISPASYVYAPGYRPFRVGQRFRRNVSGSGEFLEMPSYVNFSHTQENAYGLQIVNFNQAASGSVTDQTPVDELAIGPNQFSGNGGLLGNFRNNSPNMPDFFFEDTFFADYENPFFYNETAYLQKWNPAVVVPGQSRTISAYYRATSGFADYSGAYSAVVDAPRLIATEPGNANGLEPNPFTLRVHLDNTGGYSRIDTEFPLEDVRVQVNLPPGFSDANDPDKTVLVANIRRVEPKRMAFVDFRVRVTPEASGIRQFSVQINTPSGSNKTITGNINVATTPRLRLPSRANLVTAPWNFTQTSWEAILGLQVDEEFQAFTYDPKQLDYVIQTGPQRGVGTWLITTEPRPAFELGGEPTEPNDLYNTGAPLVQLRGGWNLVANPYNYPIPLAQIVGVSEANPNQSFTFRQLVDQGIISQTVAFWDADSPTPEYKYLQDLTDLLEPNRGYWLFVQTQQDLTLRYPPVFEPFLPRRSSRGWTQSDKQWRLQLAVRTADQVDAQNYVGRAKSAAEAKNLQQLKPPVAPIDGAVSLSIGDAKAQAASRLAHAFSEKAGRLEWPISVYSKAAGPVTITWPNLATLPKNVQLRLIDPATNTTRNLRRASGYTFQSEERSTRSFTLIAEPGTASRPVIGAVSAVRSGRSANSPLTISYTLSGEATTTVRILSGGKEVFVAARGRSDRTGQNTVVWNLRDSANRAVAPGSYTVEILAESESGERVRKFFPVNIVR